MLSDYDVDTFVATTDPVRAQEFYEEVVDGLVAREVTFLVFPGMDQDSRQIWATPDGGRVAWFHDPDGNTLSISQPGT